MAYAKINSITNANMAKVNSAAKAAIGKIGSIDAPSADFADSYSMNFDGTNDYITADGAASEISGDLGSVSLWAKLEPYSFTETMFWLTTSEDAAGVENYVWLFYHGGTNQTRLQHKGGGVEGTCVAATTVENNGWHHFAVTWNTSENQSALYIDGSSIATSTASSDFEGTEDAIDFGKRRTHSWGEFEGNMNDIALFDDVLTSGEVSTIYNAGEPTDISSHGGLVAYWKMEQNTDDSSSNSNSLTLVNGATYEADTP
jgi:hypothetical protein